MPRDDVFQWRPVDAVRATSAWDASEIDAAVVSGAPFGSYTNGNYYVLPESDVYDSTMPSYAKALIRESEDSALVLIQDFEELTVDMIFGEPKYIPGKDKMHVKCIFAREKNDEFYGKTFEIPCEQLVTYHHGIDVLNREYIQDGDYVVGLPSSRMYSITSYQSSFVGIARPSADHQFRVSSRDEEEETFYWRHRYGEASITLETFFSTEGRTGETHSVTARCFIPTFDPTQHFDTQTDLGMTHVSVFKDIGDLRAGFIYPIEKTRFKDNGLFLYITSMEEPIAYTSKDIQIVTKGELY